MLTFSNNQFYDLTPVPPPEGEYHVIFSKDKNRVFALKGPKIIESGVIFHSFNKSVSIHPKTGEIKRNYEGKAKIRGIFGNFHRDLEIE